jgi:hypothetical protein
MATECAFAFYRLGIDETQTERLKCILIKTQYRIEKQITVSRSSATC